jgi:hypothetical protein
MVYKAVMLWLISGEVIFIMVLLKGKPMVDKINAVILIAGFFVIGFIMAGALP